MFSLLATKSIIVSYFVNREVSNKKHANNVCYISESYVNSRKCVAGQKFYHNHNFQ